MSRYRFALRPWWIVSHIFILLVVIAFINLGLWQYRRLQERRASNADIAAQEALPAAPIGEVAPAPYRNVIATGTYVVDEQVLIRNVSANSAPGYWVVTPLRLADGSAVAVNRGWIPIGLGDGTDTGPYRPPDGAVTVTGRLMQTQQREGLAIADPPDGKLATLSRVDVPRLQQQVSERLNPMYVDLVTQQPAQPQSLPVPNPAPVLDDGPHLNYMGQWFIFATLTVIVYPLLIRRRARDKAVPDDDVVVERELVS